MNFCLCYRRMIDDQTALETVHSPLFSPKIVEIERFALRAAKLHECQKLLTRYI